MSLKQEADVLLEKYQIVETLSGFGEVAVHGSYDLDLMVWPEIDIAVFVDGLQSSICWDVLLALHKKSPATTAMVINHCDYQLQFVMPGSVLIDYRMWDQGIDWKLDIALMPKPTEIPDEKGQKSKVVHQSDPRVYNAMIRQRMDQNAHTVVRQIKSASIASPYYRKSRWFFSPQEQYFGSHDIFCAVFDHGVRSPEEFAEYLVKHRGISLSTTRVTK